MAPAAWRPLVSVVIPAYNAEAVIGDALRSVFAQTFRDFEVVVVDDGSTDDTVGVLEAIGGGVRLLRQPNGGPAAARNAGIAVTTAPFIAFLDADDEWFPAKLEMQTAYFAAYPEAALLHTATARAGDPRTSSAASMEPEPPSAVFCDLFHTDHDINTLTVMVRREAVEEAGGFDERREVHVEDWDLWLRIAARHKVGYLPAPTAVRRPGGGMSGDVEKTFRGQAAVIGKVAPLCALACPRHREAPAACLRRRWYRFYWELGYARRRKGQRAAAARAFLQAIARRPLAGGAWAQLAASLAGGRMAHAARHVRTAAASAGSRPEPLSLLNDTVYRRTRRLISNHVHAADSLVHRARLGERRRILFEAASPMSFVIFRPVYERLRRDPRFEFWFTATGSAWAPARLYERVGITERVVGPARAAWMKVDACINTDFWDTTWLHRRTRRIHMFHGVAGKYGLDAPLDLAPTVRSFDRILFPNEDRLRRYTESALVGEGSPAAVLAGYPKVDCLVDGTLDGAAVRRALGLDAGRPTVIYAPTWSPYSSLNHIGEALIAALAAAGYNVIVKLHDRSYDPTSRASGGVDWHSRLEVFAGHPRVKLAMSPDATPYLAAADALVTDHSSIGFEYSLLDRPLVIVDCPDLLANARVTPSKVNALRSAAEVVSSPGDAVEAIGRQLQEPGLHGVERQALARQFFYRPGTATDRAVRAIYEVLALEPHGAALPAPRIQEGLTT